MFLSYSTTAIRPIRLISGRIDIQRTRGLSMFIALRINRKGFLLFLSYGLTGPVSVLSVKSVVEKLLKDSRLFCYYQTPQLSQISLLSQEFWIVPQKRIGKSLLNEEKGIPLQPQTRKLHSETLTY